jgi:hypothetical protein
VGGPPLAGWLVVAVGAATGVSCLLRARVLAGADRRVARAEGAKGLGMALMALPAAGPAQHPWGCWLLAAAFAALTARSLAPAVRGGHGAAHHTHLALGAAAMAYMAVVAARAPGGGMAGMSGAGGVPWLDAALLAYFGLYALWAGTRMLPAAAAPAGVPVPGGLLAAPELAAACRASLCLGMFAMLLTT